MSRSRTTVCTLIAIALHLSVFPVRADLDRSYDPIAGRAVVIDGDSLKIEGYEIRLYGIDAPELGQTCMRAGRPWACGQAAAAALKDRTGIKPLLCEVINMRDGGGRVAAICRASGENLNAAMIRDGWALADPEDAPEYVVEEAEARKARRGIWAGEFTPPWEWRARHPEEAAR